jgi:hypothetical protein
MPTSGFLLVVNLAFYWPEKYDFDTYKCFFLGKNGPNLPELIINLKLPDFYNMYHQEAKV